MKRSKISAVITVAFLLTLLVGCDMGEPGPSPFQINCEEELNGHFFEDSATIQVQNVSVGGPVTGYVYTKDGSTLGTGWGTGMYTGKTTVTARVCIVDGDIKEQEIL